MKEKLICLILAVLYLLEVIILSLDLLGIFKQANPLPQMGFAWWWRVFSWPIAAACFYYTAWCLRKNPFYWKTAVMVGTTMLLGLGVDVSACCLTTVYRPFLTIDIVASFFFFIYSLKLFIEALRRVGMSG